MDELKQQLFPLVSKKNLKYLLQVRTTEYLMQIAAFVFSKSLYTSALNWENDCNFSYRCLT